MQILFTKKDNSSHDYKVYDKFTVIEFHKTLITTSFLLEIFSYHSR